MLERVEHDNGVVTYQSPLLRELGVVHGFSTRIGGISPPPYDTLNLGVLTKDPATDGNTTIAENFRRIRRAIGAQRKMRVEARQVHGAAVWSAPAGPVRPADAPCADALLSDQPDKLLVIRTADCVPVLISSDDGHVVAAVHSGWRGVVAGIVPAAVRAIYQRHGIEAARLVAAIGPCIGVEAFEVGSEVSAAFAEAGLEQAVRRGGARPHVNLREAVQHQLVHAGIRADAIDRTDRCTYRNADEFFSHRRDVTYHGLGDTGRMAALIAAQGGA